MFERNLEQQQFTYYEYYNIQSKVLVVIFNWKVKQISLSFINIKINQSVYCLFNWKNIVKIAQKFTVCNCKVFQTNKQEKKKNR